ncbi:MAG: TatD family hydrolase [Bryobacteraceae bacterium]
MKLIDSHCHLDNPQFDADREAVIERAFAAGLEQMLAIGSGDGPPDLEAGIRLADKYAAIYASIGVHPHDAANATAETYTRLAELVKHPKVVAFGEMGLDYHYDHSPRDVQRSVFVEQMRIARDAGLPIIIHTRTAWDDTLALLTEHWTATNPGGIIHCFSEGPKEAEQALALGFHISFAGIVTFPKSHAIQEAAKIVPADRILIETDAPFLAPVPKRGKRNEPAYVAETAKKVAELRGVSVEEIASTTGVNFRRLCKIGGTRSTQ